MRAIRRFTSSTFVIRKAIIVVLTLGAVTFADYTETFTEDDGVFIPHGEPGKHRGKVLTDTV